MERRAGDFDEFRLLLRLILVDPLFLWALAEESESESAESLDEDEDEELDEDEIELLESLEGSSCLSFLFLLDLDFLVNLLLYLSR